MTNKNAVPDPASKSGATNALKRIVPLSNKVKNVITEEFELLLGNPTRPVASVQPAPEVLPHIEAVLQSASLSYRDALVVQLAFWIANGRHTDITTRAEGGRGVSKWLGTYLAAMHIRAVQDAFQNVGKNTVRLDRGNAPSFDKVLHWGSSRERSSTDIEQAFHFVCVHIAANARPVMPLPRLNRGNLTFSRMCQLFVSLFASASGGAFEQFSVAALLHALIEQQGESNKYRVETKNLNASDKSSRSAGDIQILVGNRVVEALEVTANDWRDKLSGAARTIKDNDLSRLTIVASGVESAGDALFGELNKQGIDLSVLEIKSFVFSMVSALTRPGRSFALERMYELLDRHQPRVDVVNQFVESLRDMQLCD